MKFIKNGLEWDTDKSVIIGNSGWVECWYTDESGRQENRTFYETKNRRYFSVSSERPYATNLFEKLTGKGFNFEFSDPNPQIRVYRDKKDCIDWMSGYGIMRDAEEA